MVSKSQIKLITSLKQKKYRDKTGLFVAEGPKVVSELIEAGFNLHSLYTTMADAISLQEGIVVSESDLKKISFLTTANICVAVFEIPASIPVIPQGLIVALDAVRDPGNLGTIIRLCDWFGVEQLLCSNDTTDCYNPKVIQASMGSITRVNVIYVDLSAYIQKSDLPVYGGVLNGSNIYSEELSENAIIVMGNEANGISEEIIKLISKPITIPQFGANQKTESLNVATATSIILSEFRRSIEK